MKMLVFFLAKCVQTTIKTMVVDRKTKKHWLCYIWHWNCCKKLRTQAVCRLRSRQNRQGKFELFAWTLSPNFFCLNWTFHLPPKRQLSILLNFFFHWQICCWLLLSLLVLLQRGSTCDFAPKTQDSAQGYIQCMPLHIGDPVIRMDSHLSITSLPKFLGLIGYQISLAMVLCWCASAQALLIIIIMWRRILIALLTDDVTISDYMYYVYKNVVWKGSVREHFFVAFSNFS